MITELEKIKRVLWAEWDPIGVNGSDQQNDEYDAYAFRIFTMLKQGEGFDEIARYLAWLETEYIGTGSTGRHEEIAARIVQLSKA